MIKSVIDPGHGGNDRSNVGPTGYIEADGVLDISKYLGDFLNGTGDFETSLTRDIDTTLGLTDRAMIAVRAKAQLFVSEHTNACDKTEEGSEVFHSVDIPGDKQWASKLSAAVAKSINVPDRGAKVNESQKFPGEDYYTVIDVAQDNGIPHIFLVESAFHDNPKEEAKLKDTRNKMRIAIAQGLVFCKMFGIQLKVNNEILKVVQTELNKHYPPYGLTIDGIYGPDTGSAIMHFQLENKWPLNGLLDTNIMTNVYKQPVVTPEPKSQLPFYDIAGHPDEKDIIEAHDLGLINGYQDNSFRPNEPITRGDMVKIIMNTYRRLSSK